MRPSWSTSTIGLPEARLSAIAERILRSIGATTTSTPSAEEFAGRAVRRGEGPGRPVEGHADRPAGLVEPQADAPAPVEMHLVVGAPESRLRRHQGAAAQHVQRVHVLDEFGDIGVRRAQEDVLRRAALDDASAFENGDAVAELQRLVEIVADEDDRLLERPSAAPAVRPAACRG